MIGLLGPFFAPDPWQPVADPYQAPSVEHWLGTDSLGRDGLALAVHGARTSLLVATGATLIASAIGLVVGFAAGASRGLVADLWLSFIELFQTVPRFFLTLVVVSLLGAHVSFLIVVLGVTSWPPLARLARTEVLTLLGRPWASAARGLGVSEPRLLLRHVLPNAVEPLAVGIFAIVTRTVGIEAGLAFLGLADPEAISWGGLLSRAQDSLYLAWWLSAAPGIALSLTLLGLGLLAFADESGAGERRLSHPAASGRPA